MVVSWWIVAFFAQRCNIQHTLFDLLANRQYKDTFYVTIASVTLIFIEEKHLVIPYQSTASPRVWVCSVPIIMIATQYHNG